MVGLNAVDRRCGMVAGIVTLDAIFIARPGFIAADMSAPFETSGRNHSDDVVRDRAGAPRSARGSRHQSLVPERSVSRRRSKQNRRRKLASLPPRWIISRKNWHARLPESRLKAAVRSCPAHAWCLGLMLCLTRRSTPCCPELKVAGAVVSCIQPELPPGINGGRASKPGQPRRDDNTGTVSAHRRRTPQVC